MVDAKTVIAPYDRVADVDVIMNLIRPKHKQGLGNMLILDLMSSTADSAKTDNKSTDGKDAGKTDSTPATPSTAPVSEDPVDMNDKLRGLLLRKIDKKTGAVYREYGNIDALAKDYPEDSKVWVKASGYFAQDNRSDRVAVLSLDASKAYDALQAFWYFNWTFAIVADPKTSKEQLLTLSNIFEANKDRFLVLQSDDPDTFDNMEGQNYTIGIIHTGTQPIDAAWIDTANLEVGSTTWKFRNLNGITPDVLTTTELKSLDTLNLQGYTTVIGHDQTTEGKTLSGEYIDLLHGILWVQTEFQTRLEKLLQENDKIPYEQSGINMILAVGTNVLEDAWERKIIMTDDTTGNGAYTITASPRNEQSATDLSNRHYGGLSFTYHAGSAIHSITVHGSVNSDTILKV